jgi:AcrR family transcriptional regulator
MIRLMRVIGDVETATTAERILDAAIQLFAERGYAGTSVGEIERAAGLAPRSGALYQHFQGKEDVLERSLERHLEAVDDLGSALEMLPLGDLRAELTLMARWNLASLDRRVALTRFVHREGDRLPAKLRSKLYARLVELPYSRVVSWLRGRLEDAGVEEPDLHALALIMIEPMSSYRSIEQLFGRTPGKIDDARFIDAWVEVCLAYARSIGLK